MVCIPSSFFIGDNGIPLEVIAGGVSAEELTKRINKVKQAGLFVLNMEAFIQFSQADYISFAFELALFIF